jgi:pimeloyl-ACP methyl ester carboxylesterase
MPRLAFLLLIFLPWMTTPSRADFGRAIRLDHLNEHLCGRVVDYTANHGDDRRICSQTLAQRRDLYVYLPPGYDPCQKYPLVIFLHGFDGDESTFLRNAVRPLDEAMASGRLPKAIIAAPDGSVTGSSFLATHGTFFINSKIGAFEDFVFTEIYNFMHRCYPIRPEPEAHVLFGVSMGGGAAFSRAMKFQDRFRVAVGIFPPLNLRWLSCRGRYFDDFDPCCGTYRTDFSRGHEPLAKFFGGAITVRLGQALYPLYGRDNPNLAELVAMDNPIEMLDAYNIKRGDLELFIGYAGNDEFNIDAQVESFLYRAKQKKICVTTAYDPDGRHNARTALKLLPYAIDWIAPRLRPYSPK